MDFDTYRQADDEYFWDTFGERMHAALNPRESVQMRLALARDRVLARARGRAGRSATLAAERQLHEAQIAARQQVAVAQTASQKAVALFEQQLEALKALHRLAAETIGQHPDLQDVIGVLLQQHQQSYAELVGVAPHAEPSRPASSG